MNYLFRYKLDHIFFWVLTVFFHGFIRIELLEKGGLPYFILELIIRNGLLAVVIYVNLLFVIPRYYSRSKYSVGVCLTVLPVFAYVAFKNAHDMYTYGYVLNVEEQRNFFYGTFYNLSIVLFYLTFSVTLYLSKQWYLQQRRIREIELEKLNTELAYLKAQINPHFLFNSINTIFFQIDKQNATARHTLSRFSDMLRYQLYECNGMEIPIEKELTYLKNYVELQRVRMDDNYRVEFTADQAIRDFSIAPLVMIPFVENAFKHISHFTDKLNRIEIHLGQHSQGFRLEVFNTCQVRYDRANGGIGLRNAKRRLELLYPGRHELTISEAPDFFSVTLKLQLTASL